MKFNNEIEGGNGEEEIRRVIKKEKKLDNHTTATVTQQQNIRMDISSKNILNIKKAPNVGQNHLGIPSSSDVIN